MGILDKLFPKKGPVDFPPKPKWKPNVPVDLNRILDHAKIYTNYKLQLGIFSNGTVAYFPEKVGDVSIESLAILDKIYNFHPDFKPLEMKDGNYLVEYSQPAFTIVFKEEIVNYWNYIDVNHLDGLCPSEALINGKGEINTFDRIGKIALFGRARIFQDAQSQKIVEIYDPFSSTSIGT